MTNEFQESTSESVSELAIDELTSELTRTSTRSNKEIFTSTKFKDKNFDKKSRQIHMTKLIRNINFDDKNKSTMMQEVINHLIWEKQWKKAFQDKYNSLMKNHIWDLIHRSKNHRIVINKWAFKHKKSEIAWIIRLKIRLMTREFNQIYNIDYLDIYASIVKLTSIRILLVIAAIYDLEIHQMNMMTIFLAGDLKEEIFMK